MKTFDSPADLLDEVAKNLHTAADVLRREANWSKETCVVEKIENDDGPDAVVMIPPNLNDDDFLYERLVEMLTKAWVAEHFALDFMVSQMESVATVEVEAAEKS